MSESLFDRVVGHLTNDWPQIIGFPLAMIWMLGHRLVSILFIPPKYWDFE